MEDTPKPRRRWFRFSLRTMLIFIATVAVGLSWTLREARRQQQVLERLENLGGVVKIYSPKPSWLPERFDIWRLGRARWFEGGAVQASKIPDLAELKNLETLFLSESKVRDLSPLAGLVKVRHLHLSLSPVVDLSPLANLSQLEVLHLDSSEIEDLAGLEGLARLAILHLEHTKVKNLKPLANLKNLNFLSLANSSVSDLAPLRNMTSL